MGVLRLGCSLLVALAVASIGLAVRAAPITSGSGWLTFDNFIIRRGATLFPPLAAVPTNNGIRFVEPIVVADGDHEGFQFSFDVHTVGNALVTALIYTDSRTEVGDGRVYVYDREVYNIGPDPCPECDDYFEPIGYWFRDNIGLINQPVPDFLVFAVYEFETVRPGDIAGLSWFEFTFIPEPSTASLMALGLVALPLVARSRRAH